MAVQDHRLGSPQSVRKATPRRQGGAEPGAPELDLKETPNEVMYTSTEMHSQEGAKAKRYHCPSTSRFHPVTRSHPWQHAKN